MDVTPARHRRLRLLGARNHRDRGWAHQERPAVARREGTHPRRTGLQPPI